MLRIEQIHSCIPPEQLLYYQSEAGREVIHAELRARRQSMSQSREEGTPPSAAEMLLQKVVDLTAPSPRAISVSDLSGQHDATGNEIHAPADGCHGGLAVGRVASDLGILDKA